MAGQKEPMIGQESRPTAINFDTPVSELKVRDLMGIIGAQVAEQAKLTSAPEHLKPEHKETIKELLKPEKEHKEIIKELLKPEKEFKELLKPEKELFKPEKELSKPEKEVITPELTERVAGRVVEMLKEQGLIK